MKKILIILVLFLSTQTIFSGDLSIGGMAGSPMRMGFGARGIGMGNALGAVTSGDISTYYNPALAPFQVGYAGTVSFGFLSLDRRLNFLQIGTPVKPTAGISLSIVNAGVGNIEGRNRSGLIDETYSTSENAFIFSFGNRFSEKLTVGISTKIFYYYLFEEMSSTTVGIDLGLLYRVSSDVTGAVVIQDIGSKYKWDSSKLYGKEGSSDTDFFPLRYRVALAYHNQDWGTLLGSEVEWIGKELFFRSGAELKLIEQFSVRAGIDQISRFAKTDAKPSFGFSVTTHFQNWETSVYYTYVIENIAPSNIHLISVAIRRQ